MGLADHPLTALRLAKHQAILDDAGYPFRFERSHLASELHDSHGDLEPGTETGETVVVAGRIRNIRAMGKLTFVVLSDVSGSIQLFVDKRTLGEDGFAAFADLDIGDWVGAGGELITTRKGELSVRIDSFELLTKALRPLPDKFHGLTDVEARSRQRYLDLMVNQEARDTALVRSKVISLFRREFEARGYVEVETPVLLNQATGAMARPFETHHNALDIDMVLRIATELYLKRLVVGGLEKVFEVGKTFRNEGIDATHMPEFTMLESYEALAGYEDIAQMVEEMIAVIAAEVSGSTVLTYQERTLDLTPPYERRPMLGMVNEVIEGEVSFSLTLPEAIAVARGNGIEPESHWGHGKIIEELFDRHVQPSIWEPVFVTQHPVEISPLARKHPDDPNVTERWELFIAGSEYGNAFSELNEPLDQRRRFEAQMELKAAGDDEAQEIDEDFVRALEYGMPPTGGLGIGIDRLVMLLTDQAHIRDVILFPTMRPLA
ncbi:MAG: lysine--tRNA ligase [bacterium]|nr:lysine--tRNA ligase [bacterium]